MEFGGRIKQSEFRRAGELITIITDESRCAVTVAGANPSTGFLTPLVSHHIYILRECATYNMCLYAVFFFSTDLIYLVSTLRCGTQILITVGGEVNEGRYYSYLYFIVSKRRSFSLIHPPNIKPK